MKNTLLTLLPVFLLVSCEKIDMHDYAPIVQTTEQQPSDTTDILLIQNDTVRIYLSSAYVAHVLLSEHSDPSQLITDPRFRMPTREEALILKTLAAPAVYTTIQERILCIQHSEGMPTYYTFTFGNTSSITKAGFKTKYALLPIRTERTSPTTPSTQNVGFDISINDEWE